MINGCVLYLQLGKSNDLYYKVCCGCEKCFHSFGCSNMDTNKNNGDSKKLTKNEENVATSIEYNDAKLTHPEQSPSP